MTPMCLFVEGIQPRFALGSPLLSLNTTHGLVTLRILSAVLLQPGVIYAHARNLTSVFTNLLKMPLSVNLQQ